MKSVVGADVAMEVVAIRSRFPVFNFCLNVLAAMGVGSQNLQADSKPSFPLNTCCNNSYDCPYDFEIEIQEEQLCPLP